MASRWLVILKGTDSSLRILASYLTHGTAKVECIGGLYYLSSVHFASMDDPGLVEERAADMLAAANSATSVEVQAYRPTVEVVAAVLHDEDKPVPVVIVPDPAVMEITTFPPTILTNGAPTDPPEPRIALRIELAFTDDDVREVFGYLDHPDLIWFDLYKIGEVIERSAGGQRQLFKRPWIDEREYRRCRQTSNHYRHAKSPKYPLPPKPMTLSRAKKYMKQVVDGWLRNERGV